MLMIIVECSRYYDRVGTGFYGGHGEETLTQTGVGEGLKKAVALNQTFENIKK